MKYSNYSVLFVLVISSALIQSCSNDTDVQYDVKQEENTNASQVTTALITDWNNLWLEVDRHAYGMRPTATARSLAYIHLAAYETAVEEMDGYTSNRNRLQGFNINPSQREENIDIALALNTCYALVIDHFMYKVDNEIDIKVGELKNTKEGELSATLSASEIANSINWGTYVANTIISFSQTDVQAEDQILDPQPLSYEPPTGAGFWTYSADPERAWFPYWGEVRTFVISSEQTTSVAPSIAYSEDPTSVCYTQMNEVYVISNNAKVENNEDLWIAEYWSDDVEGLMLSPPGRQISIAMQLIEAHDLSYETALSMFLKLGFSLNDAAVSAWADKYEYMVMRPSVYIQNFIDPEFQTNLYRFINWPNPTFPGYPSGHSTFASAAAGIFINEFGDAINFTDRTHEGRTEFKGAPRTFTSFSAMAEENGFARIPLGVHIRIDCTEGLRLGYEIAAAVNNFDLQN